MAFREALKIAQGNRLLKILVVLIIALVLTSYLFADYWPFAENHAAPVEPNIDEDLIEYDEDYLEELFAEPLLDAQVEVATGSEFDLPEHEPNNLEAKAVADLVQPAAEVDIKPGGEVKGDYHEFVAELYGGFQRIPITHDAETVNQEEGDLQSDQTESGNISPENLDNQGTLQRIDFSSKFVSVLRDEQASEDADQYRNRLINGKAPPEKAEDYTASLEYLKEKGIPQGYDVSFKSLSNLRDEGAKEYLTQPSGAGVRNGDLLRENDKQQEIIRKQLESLGFYRKSIAGSEAADAHVQSAKKVRLDETAPHESVLESPLRVVEQDDDESRLPSLTRSVQSSLALAEDDAERSDDVARSPAILLFPPVNYKGERVGRYRFVPYVKPK